MIFFKRISIIRVLVLFITIFVSISYILGSIASSGWLQKKNTFIKAIKRTNKNTEQKDSACTFYKWFHPNTNDEEGKMLLKNCSSCHMAYYKEWVIDKHSMSQNNLLFLSLYSGTDKNGNQNIYPGFRLDHPQQNGNCTLCHNPEAALDNDFDVDLRSKISQNTNGISCDFCHKIESVDQDPLKTGVKGLNITRICKGFKDIRYGPIKDPIQPSKYEELKYNSLYKTSLSCAKCHDGSNGNILIYSTFTEWVNSPAAKKGIQCQTCHMQPRNKKGSDKYSIVDNPDVKHKLRPYFEVHSHSFLTDSPHNFRKEYIDLSLKAKKENDRILVTAVVENNNFGHSFPTGNPMRNAILVISAEDENGKELKLLNGSILPDFAGNLRGKTGKMFAKILAETSGEYARKHSKGGIDYRKLANKVGIPAQDWWNVYIANDTRIKANETDESIYEFETKLDKSEIAAKIIWRNTWYGLAKIKGFDLEEDLIAEEKISL